ncbi:MAG TPA: TonB-dependent receptor [Steroidobacteraceae bacterium]|nr:TonB-dependent receptor [Steroidobacteraceae bacterium]
MSHSSASVAALAITIAWSACIDIAVADPTDTPIAVGTLTEIQVVANRLNEARSTIETQTGASTYTINAAAVAATPGGDNTLLNQVIMQAPEVAQDSFGQFHVRGEHNGLQYRINGLILPEGISVFGQSLDPRLISSMSLITGALPAEYGLRTAGIIDISTKSGLMEPGGAVSLYGGSHSQVEPSFNYGGGSGSFSYFISGDFLRNDLGIESPDGSTNPIHDHTTQSHVFGYFEDILDEHNRVALMIGSSVGKFQIPDLNGEQPSLGLTVNGQTMYPSQDLNENQREITQFGVVSWQHSVGALNVQSSFVARYSSLTFVPDPLGDLLFTGVAQAAFKQNVAYAGQTDGSYQLSDSHTLRAGAFLQTDHSISQTTSQVLLTNSAGVPLSDIPTSIVDNGAKTEYIYSAYLQDEWKVQPTVTFNYGLRLDRFTAYTSAGQASPRLNAVWQVLPDTTVHAGYARYLSPPPFELVGGKDIALFQNTTNPPLSPGATSPLAERANYYDIGMQQKVGRELTLGLDTYAKQSVNLIDEGQFGAPIILTPFNYRYGKQYGIEGTLNYTTPNFVAYLNLAAQSAKGKEIDSAQFNFATPDLAWIQNNYIHLDHEQQRTASGGVSYLWQGTRISADLLYGSGLRASLPLPAGETTPYGGASIPNGVSLPTYTQANLGLTHVFHPASTGPLTARFDVINMFDKDYQIRNGTGVGVGAPQYGPRRGFFAGLSLAL